MNKNTVKSDFEKSSLIDGKNQIKNGRDYVDYVFMCERVYFNYV